MEKLIRNLENKSLSNHELLKMINNKANLLIYSELSKKKTIDQVLGKHGACIILYETKKDYGHWCCIFKLNKNTLEFFDPYGKKVDQQLKWIDNNFRKHHNEWYPHLSSLLLKSSYKLTYNNYKFQKFEKEVNTCGRWVGLRLKFRHLSLEEFKKIFKKKRDETPDFYATLLTELIS